MPMYKYGNANVVKTAITGDAWTNQVYKDACKDGQCRIKTAKSIIAKYSPDKYLLCHCSIIASVNVELADLKDSKSDYYIRPEFSQFVNNNGDAWTSGVILNSYRTFTGGENYLEHVQIPELSKGKIIDAVPREIVIGKDKNGKDLSTIYVDILVATDRKHEDLVRKIEAGEYSSLSMGCFWAGTEITMSDGSKQPIELIRPGDSVLTHNGVSQPVMNIQRKWHSGTVLALQIEGDYKTTYVTHEHPYWGFKREQECACGCGEKINVKLTGYKNNFDGKNFIFSKYKKGHYARIVNPNNKCYSVEEFLQKKEDNSIKSKMDLGWIKAGDLKAGDLVSYPISEQVINSIDATAEKARLIGYFLSEGSFVKEIVAQGEETDYGVKCRICGNLYNKISTHLPSHKITFDQYKLQFPDAPVNAKISKPVIRTSRKEDISEETGLIRTHKKIGVEFSLGKHEYETLNKEICELSKIVFPEATILRYEDSVKIIGIRIAEFFLKYCGEYFDGKGLPEEVLFWPKNIQKHIIATWILGDYAATSSKKLFSQMHYIFIRNKVWHNTVYKEAHPYSTTIKKKCSNGEVFEKVYTGIRSESYMLQLSPLSFDSVKDELNHAFEYRTKKFKSPKNLVANSWKNVQSFNWLVRKISNIQEIPYEGWVYNFEVKEDNSYIANDVAVHNCLIKYSICSKCGKKAADETEACEHIRFQKNNMFFDENGIQRKIAELCGHESDPESVKFIEASWVRQPAFTGAILRNFVEPSDELMVKLEAAKKVESYKKKPGDYLKAAVDQGLIAQDEPPKNEPSTEDASPEDAPPEDVPPEEMPVEEENDLKTFKKDLKQKVLKQVSDEVMEELSDDETLGVPRDVETLDETLIKPASMAMAKVWGAHKSWDRFINQKLSKNFIDKKLYDKLRYGIHIAMTNDNLTVLKDYGYSKRDFLAVLSFMDSCFKNPLPIKVKQTIAKLGGSQNKSPVELLKIVVSSLGRKISREEANKILAWLRLLDFYK